MKYAGLVGLKWTEKRNANHRAMKMNKRDADAGTGKTQSISVMHGANNTKDATADATGARRTKIRRRTSRGLRCVRSSARR